MASALRAMIGTETGKPEYLVQDLLKGSQIAFAADGTILERTDYQP